MGLVYRCHEDELRCISRILPQKIAKYGSENAKNNRKAVAAEIFG